MKHLNLTADRFGDIVDEENDLVISIYPPSLKRPNAWDLKEVTAMVESVYDLYAALDRLAGLVKLTTRIPIPEGSTLADSEAYQLALAALRRARGEK